ncbi:MAG: hypothetical protein QOJ11_322 [Frankiales bacterium]|jgi:hypothetical protein|nr:hypothetical protein [Frankiales bacterium]
MNEDQAQELFAPARERVMPPARFSMAEVYETDARIHRGHRRAAVVATVAAVVVAATGTWALSGGADHRGSAPTVTPGTVSPTTSDGRPPSLSEALDHIPVPPGSVQHPVAEAGQASMQVGMNPRTVREARYWTTSLSRKSALAWLDKHLHPLYTGSLGGTSGDNTSFGLYNGPANTYEDGPNLTVSVIDRGTGSGILVQAWEVPLAQKAAAETLHGVTAVKATLTANGAPALVLGTTTLAGAQAGRLADDINALPVDPGLGGSCTNGAPGVTLQFTTAEGPRSFVIDRNCRFVQMVHGPANAAGLTLSPALIADLAPVDALSSIGLLDVALTTDKGSRTPDRAPLFGGTVQLHQGGAVVKTVAASAGKQLQLRLAAGPYSVSATVPGKSCAPVQVVTVERYQEIGIVLVCRPS